MSGFRYNYLALDDVVLVVDNIVSLDDGVVAVVDDDGIVVVDDDDVVLVIADDDIIVFCILICSSIRNFADAVLVIVVLVVVAFANVVLVLLANAWPD